MDLERGPLSAWLTRRGRPRWRYRGDRARDGRVAAPAPWMRAGVKRGSSSSIRAPPAALSQTATRPPWASAIARTIASPRPVPPEARSRAASVRWKRSNDALALGGGDPGPVVLDDEAHALLPPRAPGVWAHRPRSATPLTGALDVQLHTPGPARGLAVHSMSKRTRPGT